MKNKNFGLVWKDEKEQIKEFEHLKNIFYSGRKKGEYLTIFGFMSLIVFKIYKTINLVKYDLEDIFFNSIISFCFIGIVIWIIGYSLEYFFKKEILNLKIKKQINKIRKKYGN